MTWHEWLIGLLVLQALIAWTVAVVLAFRRGRTAIDDIMSCVLAPIWGLGIPVSCWVAWRHRHGLRTELANTTRAALAAVTAWVRGAPTAVASWCRDVRQMFSASGVDRGSAIATTAGDTDNRSGSSTPTDIDP